MNIPMLTYDHDDPRHKLGRALVLLCEWGREARKRQAETSTEGVSPMEGAPDSQEATTVIENTGD